MGEKDFEEQTSCATEWIGITEQRDHFVLIAQISDLHITEVDVRAYGQVDTTAHLERVVDALNALTVQPDIVLGTGDLVHTGTPAEYARLRAILAHLKAPFVPVMGNHDSRAALLPAFALPPQEGSHIQYAIDHFPVRILVLDSVTEGSDEPSFCAARTAWLDRALGESGRPALIAIHHPPFAGGVAWLRSKNVHWATPLHALVARAPHVRRIVCGHVHRGMTRLWAGVLVTSAPSTAHQVVPDLAPDAPSLLSHEAPGFHLHQWEDGDFTTYAVSVAGLADVFSPEG